MSRKPNPFAILGVERSVVKDLAEHEVLAIVEARNRTLSSLFHPDVKSGDKSRRFEDFQWARDELFRPGMFAHYRHLYLRSKAEEEAEVRLEEFWLVYAAGRAIRKHSWLDTRVASLSAFDMPPCRIRLVDELEGTHSHHPRHRQPAARPKAARDRQPIPTNVYDVELDKEGGLTLYALECVPYDWRRPDPTPSGLPGGLPHDWYFLMKGPGQVIGRWMRTKEDPERLEGRILGALILKDEQAEIDLGQAWLRRLTSSRGSCGASQLQAARSGYSLDVIVPFFPFISPIIREGNDCKTSLITVVVREGKPFFRILGSVTEIYSYERTRGPV
jgi:hypothetical protein